MLIYTIRTAGSLEHVLKEYNALQVHHKALSDIREMIIITIKLNFLR
jgi:hypothetical protein